MLVGVAMNLMLRPWLSLLPSMLWQPPVLAGLLRCQGGS